MIHIPASDYEIFAIRAQGAGGQHVNKVSSAIHLRFDINASSLSEAIKLKLLNSQDKRISKEGVVVIKAQQYRTQEANKRDAVNRLNALVNVTNYVKPMRKKTKPSYSSTQRRLDSKSHRGKVKALRKVSKID